MGIATSRVETSYRQGRRMVYVHWSWYVACAMIYCWTVRTDGLGDGLECNMAYTASDIADFFIWRANTGEEFGENISNLKLQKLVYYAQGFSLALNGRPLFHDAIEAWAHGPVVRTLYFKHREHGAGAIPTPEDFSVETMDQETLDLLEEVYSVYGQYSAWALRNMTHDEFPWKNTPMNGVIPQEQMRMFFQTQLTDG